MIEALVVGRVGVDFTPATPRTSLADADAFVRSVGGFAGNIGTGLARLGVRTGVISGVGDDGHADHVRASLAAVGVDVLPIVTRPGRRTQVAFFEAWPPEHFPVTFYRDTPAPESLLSVADLPTDLLEEAPVVIVSGSLLSSEPARSTVVRILEDRRASRPVRARSWTILDIDWRPTLWEDPGAAPALLERAMSLCDVLIGSDAEFAATRLRPDIVAAGGPIMLVLKHGPEGVSLVTAMGTHDRPGIAVDVVCGLGAGDALTASFAAGLIRGLDPVVAVERGNAAGAIVASRLMCSASMPTQDEIDGLLARVAVGSAEVKA